MSLEKSKIFKKGAFFLPTLSKKFLKKQLEQLELLKQRCLNCFYFRNRIPDEIYSYTPEYNYSDMPEMIAICRYGNTYAVASASYLSDNQLKIFENFLKEVIKEKDKIVVFSIRDFNTIKKFAPKNFISNLTFETFKFG